MINNSQNVNIKLVVDILWRLELNKLDSKLLKKKDDFIVIDDEKYQIVFTNAEKDRSFNRNTEEGINEINSLQREFDANDIIYLKQIHSDKILVHRCNDKSIKDEEGDAIITNEKNVIIASPSSSFILLLLHR